MAFDRIHFTASSVAIAQDSLRRLGTETIDLYQAHADDPTVPLGEATGDDGAVDTGAVAAGSREQDLLGVSHGPNRR